jgi:hypothetical protein
MQNHRRREGRTRLAVAAAFVTLLIPPAVLAPSARAQNSPKPLTPEERQELERRGYELNQAALEQELQGEYELAS